MLKSLAWLAFVGPVAIYAAPPAVEEARCERLALEWVEAAAKGDNETAIAAAWNELGVRALDAESIRRLANATERVDEKDRVVFGASLGEAEAWGSFRMTPTSLVVMAAERRTHGVTPWLARFVLRNGQWRLVDLSNGPEAQEYAPRFALFIDPAGRLSSPPTIPGQEFTPPRRAPAPDELKTPADCEAAVLAIARRLGAGDSSAAVAEAYRTLGVASWDADQLRAKLAPLRSIAVYETPLGARLEGEAECMGHLRLGDRSLVVPVAVPQELGHSWWLFHFQWTDRGWRLSEVAAGAIAEGHGYSVAIRRRVERQERSWPPLGSPRDAAAATRRPPDAKAFSDDVVQLAAELANDRFDGRLPAMLEKASAVKRRQGESGVEPAARLAAEDRALEPRLGKRTGKVNRIGRVDWGSRWTSELFLIEREYGVRWWAVSAYRPHEALLPAKIDAGPDAVRFSPKCFRPFPAWRDPAKAEFPRFDDRFVHDKGKTAPPVLATEQECQAAAGRFARDLTGDDLNGAVETCLASYAPNMPPATAERLTKELAAAAQLEREKHGTPMQVEPEFLGTLMRGPSQLVALFLLRREREPLPVAVTFYRGQESWRIQRLRAGVPAFQDCAWALRYSSE